MPIVREKKKTRVQTFNAGQDSNSEPTAVKTPFASLAKDAVIDKAGKCEQRLGLEEVGENPATLKVDLNTYSEAFVDAETNIAAANITESSISYDSGKFAQAAQFNGTSSYVSIAATETEISVDTMGAFVITTWIYVDSDGQNDSGYIFDKSDAATYNAAITTGYRAWVHTEDSNTVELSFEVAYDATNAFVETSTTMSTDAWHKVEFHHNADKSLDIYIDGAVASYDTDTSGDADPADDSANVFYLGNCNNNDAAFDGAMEKIRIYDGARAAIEYEQKRIMALTHYKVGSLIDKIVRIRNNALETLDDNQLGWSSIDAGFTADTETNFVQAKDILFILNGTENVHSMDSSESITDEGNTNTDAPRTTIGAWAQNNRLFLSGSLTDSERDYVWFSDSLDPQTYDRTLNVFKVRSGSGGKVTGLKPFKNNELIIYKSDSVFVLDMTGATPLTNWTLQPLATDVGTKSPNSIQDLGNDQIFLDSEAYVRLLTRTSFDKLKTSIISGPIQDILDEINKDALDKVCSAFIDGKYILAFPTDTYTENNRVVIWDSVAARLAGKPDAGWTTLDKNIWYPKCMCTYEFGDNEKRLVIGDSREINKVYKQKGNTDLGKTISLEVAGPTHDLGNRGTYKIWGPLHCVWNAGEATTAEMFANIDEAGWESIGTLSLAGGAPTLPIDLPFNLSGSDKATEIFQVKNIGRGKICRIKAQHAQNNNSATFIEYELYAEERIPKP